MQKKHFAFKKFRKSSNGLQIYDFGNVKLRLEKALREIKDVFMCVTYLLRII